MTNKMVATVPADAGAGPRTTGAGPQAGRGPARGLSGLSGRAVEILFLAVVITGFVASPNFLTSFNLQGLLSQAAVLGILAIGQYIVIVAGGFDLSVGAVAAVSSMVVASTLGDLGVLGILLAIASGAALGLLSGLAVTVGRIPPIVATLGVAGIAQGVAFTISNRGIVITDSAFMTLNSTSFGFVPLLFVIWAVLVAVVFAFLRLTRTGLYFFAIGGNADSARLAGVPVARVQMTAFALSGMLAGAAGVLFAARANSGLPGLGVGWELDTIAAVVIGGVSLYGGQGNLVKAMIGVLTYLMITNVMNLADVDSYLQNVLKGVLILAAVAAPAVLRRRNHLMGRTS
ncbi:MAG: Monosaccharide transporter rane protein family [Modestobacter sp.]|jgi:ribose/xylose/arabinose/galactoside ABC-type transport system permease subunit|nr:Monosaccharide transporter rane protein family [Modestobacter sp.]